MAKKNPSLDELDLQIMEILQDNCRIPIGKIAKQLEVPKSTVHFRIKRLEAAKIIRGWHAKLDATKLGKDYTTITFVRAKFGENYHKRVGEKLAQIPGVAGVYFIFGDNDFVVLTVSEGRKEFLEKLEQIYKMSDIREPALWL